MADPTARTLRLLSLLQRHHHWTGADLADRLGVSERTLRRDVERLRELGYTVLSDRGVDGGYRLTGSTGGAALLLDDDEATALAVALHSAACDTTELAEASLGALSKLVTMLGPAQRQRAEAVRTTVAFGVAPGGASPTLSVVDAVAAACRDQVRLSFDYVAADGAASSRYVQPSQLVALDRRWYLVAFDDARDDWRTFGLDRMSSPVLARNSFPRRPPPADDMAEYVRSNIGAAASQRVVFDVAAPDDQVRARYGTWVTVEARGRDACRVTMVADSFEWPAHVVAGLDAPVTMVAPDEFRDHLRLVASRLTAAARAAGARPRR